MKDLVIDTILASKKSMIAVNRKYTAFEFFGYDFLIDEDLRLWLIEVTNQCLLAASHSFMIAGEHEPVHRHSK